MVPSQCCPRPADEDRHKSKFRGLNQVKPIGFFAFPISFSNETFENLADVFQCLM